MRDKKGFSLIELLAALIIMGLILLVVIPATARLLTSNEVKEYNNYFKIIESGAKRYADIKKDDLGGSKDEGCIEVSLDDLIKKEYVKAFDDKKVTCSGKVRINNNKGNLQVSTNITCVDENNKETFKKEKITEGNCIAFVPKEDGGLKNKLINNGVGSGGSTAVDDGQTFIRGRNPNNYVWYSGKLWRVVYYDNESVKLISDEIITIMNRGDIGYKNSSVKKWLETIFLPTLKDANKYLVDTKWNVTMSSMTSFRPEETDIVTSKVGLLNGYEIGSIGRFIDGTYEWLVANPSGGTRIWVASTGGSVSERAYSDYKYFAIRPAITMDPTVYVVSGNGSKALPYILEGNSTNVAKGTLINTRYSGEYLKINGVSYRIVNVSNNLTKVIMVDTLSERQYDSEGQYNYSYSKLYDYLNSEWYSTALDDDKNLIYDKGAWCPASIGYGIKFEQGCSVDYISSPVGIPTLGDIYTANNDAKTNTFWTINPYQTIAGAQMNVIEKDTKKSLGVSSKASIKPVMYLKSNVIINSGEGTKDNPFILGLK